MGYLFVPRRRWAYLQALGMPRCCVRAFVLSLVHVIWPIGHRGGGAGARRTRLLCAMCARQAPAPPGRSSRSRAVRAQCAQCAAPKRKRMRHAPTDSSQRGRQVSSNDSRDARQCGKMHIIRAVV